jgi:outer membrane protein
MVLPGAGNYFGKVLRRLSVIRGLRGAAMGWALSLLTLAGAVTAAEAPEVQNPSAGATGAGPLLTVEAAVRICLENNFSLSLAHDQAAQATVDREAGIGPFLPSASAELNHGADLHGSAPVAGPASTSIGASLNLQVFDGFQDYYGYHRLKTQERSAQLKERIALEDALETVLGDYYDVVRQKQNLAAIRELLAVSRERATLARAKLEVGAGSRLEQLQSLADFNADSSSYLSQEVALREAKLRLNQLLARAPAAEFDVGDSIPLDARLPLDRLTADLAGHNAAVLDAATRREAAAYSLKAARGGYLPSVNAGLGYSANPAALNGDVPGAGRDGFRYSVGLSVPIFDRLATRRSVSTAHLDLRQGETRVREAEEAAKAAFEQARGRYTAGLARVTLEAGNLEVALLQEEAALERYKVGATSPLEFRDAQRKLLDARVRLLAARYDTKQAELGVKRLAGALVRTTAEAPGAAAGDGKVAPAEGK